MSKPQEAYVRYLELTTVRDFYRTIARTIVEKTDGIEARIYAADLLDRADALDAKLLMETAF